MKSSIDFDYSECETVFILPLKVIGKINGLMVSDGSKSYRVLYWWEGNRKQEWLCEHEIEKLGT